MNTFSTALLVTMSLSYLVCDGAIWDCNGRQEGSHMSWHGADKCANEGGNEYCTGPGRIYYGDGLTWTYKDLGEGQRVGCNNGAFGCDPLPLFPKKCYNSCDLFHECAKTGEVATQIMSGAGDNRRVLTIDEKIVGCDCREIRSEIWERLEADELFPNQERHIDEVWRNMECKPVLPQPAGVCN